MLFREKDLFLRNIDIYEDRSQSKSLRSYNNEIFLSSFINGEKLEFESENDINFYGRIIEYKLNNFLKKELVIYKKLKALDVEMSNRHE